MAEASEAEAWEIVGRLGRTRGRRGELKAEIYSSQPGRGERLREVKLAKGAASRIVRVEGRWRHDGQLVLKFKGVDSISDAEAWEHADLLVRRAELVKPADGEFLHTDLIGCAVYEEGSAPALGVVRGIEDYGGAPLLEVADAGGRVILIPLARSICREIDVVNKVIRAKLPEGLTEL